MPIQVVYTNRYKLTFRSIYLHFKDVDEYEGTSLAEYLPQYVDLAIENICKYPDAYPNYRLSLSRRYTLEKFKSHYIIYNYNSVNQVITLLEIRGYKQK